MQVNLAEIRAAIIKDSANHRFLQKGWRPVYSAHKSAKILIVGQAPGRLAQESGIPWNDPSGDNLRSWLGIERDIFYDEEKIALVPMDFFFPGSKEGGDMPPRKGFAQKWHPLILKNLTNVELTILIGQYSQEYYLGARRKETLTNTVRAFEKYLPDFVPLVHPSPRNNIWQKGNPWFKKLIIPKLRKLVEALM